MYNTMKRKGIQAFHIRMRMIAIREAQETMEREVNEQSNPSVFLA
jgi:hypothetical protein